MAYTNIMDETSALRMPVQQQNKAAFEPVSRTYQYRKVMKPMLERKRRARINRCLDELKDLMVTALQAEGENVSKLEKADILELTVKHLHRLRKTQQLAGSPSLEQDKFRAGFISAANEVSRCLASTAGVDIHLGTKLMTHLGHRLNDMDKVSPLSIQVSSQSYTPPSSPVSCHSNTSSMYYQMPLTPTSSASISPKPIDCTSYQTGLLKVIQPAEDKMWRPW